MSDEARLIEKLRRIEALHAGATTEGERVAAAEAKKRILARLSETAVTDPPVEKYFTIADGWSRQVFNALARRYGLKPYRYKRQHRQTVVLRVGARFLDQVLWPQFIAISGELDRHLQTITSRVIREALDESSSEADEVQGSPQLGDGNRK